MGTHTSDTAGGRFDEWEYACSVCGSPYRSRPAICYDCGNDAIASVDRVLADSGRHDP